MKIIKLLLFSLFICLSFSLSTNNAEAISSISYCGEFENYKCIKPYNNPGDLWDNTTWADFYNSSGFETESTYFKFHTLHFDFYIPYYVVEREFSADDTDGYFTMNEWMNYDKNKNFVSDDIDDVVEKFEDIYSWYVDYYKIKVPWKGGGDDRMAVFLADIEESANGLYSYKEYGEPYIQIDLAKALSFDALKGTIAHEMQHAIQNGYISSEYLALNNFAEGMAVMLQSKLYNGGEHHLDFDDVSPKQNPGKSIFGLSVAGDVASYGSYLWYSFLHQKYGGSIVNELLESYASFANSNIDNSMEYLAFLAVNQALKNHSTDVVNAYTEFALWNYDKGKYTDGKKMRPVSITKVHDSYIKEYKMGLDAPNLFGSNYVEVNMAGNLQVNFTGNTNGEFHLWFLPLRQDSSVDYTKVVQKMINFGATENVILPFEGNYKKFIMIVSVVDASIDETQDGDAFNQYIYPYVYSIQTATDEQLDSLDLQQNTLTDEQLNESTEDADKKPNNEVPSIFTDVLLNNQNYDAIFYLKNKGIINGYADGTFKPNNDVNRAELLKIIIEGMNLKPDVNEFSECFKDIKTEWFAPYICYAKSVRWVNGYPDGTFKPAQTVNKVEAIKILLNSQGIILPDSVEEKPFDDVNINDWFAPFVTKAKQLDILEETGPTFEPSKGMTRGSISENLYRLLTL